MKNEINLLPPKKKLSSKDSKDLKILRFLTVGMLVTVACLSVGAFFITALSPLNNLKKEEAEYSQQLDSLRPKAAQYLLTQNRLKEASTFLTARLKHPELLADIESQGTELIVFSGIEISARNVLLTVTSNSLQEIDTLLNAVKVKSEKETLFKNLTLSSLEYNKESSEGYRVRMSVEFR